MKKGMEKKLNCKSIILENLTKRKWIVKVLIHIKISTYKYLNLLILGAEIDAEIKVSERQEVPVRKIEGLSLPYLLVTMDSGTLCDLNGKPRMTRVYYVCYPAGKHEIFSLEEASSCEYEIVVLTPYLCQHPDYRCV
jgi:endoplasmic reticulum lectin 1